MFLTRGFPATAIIQFKRSPKYPNTIEPPIVTERILQKIQKQRYQLYCLLYKDVSNTLKSNCL
jgi:hypothetical protein